MHYHKIAKLKAIYCRKLKILQNLDLFFHKIYRSLDARAFAMATTSTKN